MADTRDYLSVYSRFFEEFARTVNPDDQLPVKVGGYYLCDAELVGEIVDWTLQYLNQKHCPSSLLAPLTRIVIEEIKNACKKQPEACGYRTDNTYQPLKLMQVVTGKVNEVCLRYHDNGKLASLPPPSPGPPISSCAIKNSRRRMEDRHVIIEDFHAVFNIQDRSPASFYAVFDGHAGTDAAMYSVSHLHQFLAESPYYPTDPERALKDAFSRTDSLFLEKSNRENLRSGTTAVCALLRHKEKMLYVAWLGDSQALLVREGKAVQVVNPHKPDRQDERERIEDMGGCVMYWGTWRVNGQLAVSRAIGDFDYKPYVTSEPDLTAVPLDGAEDFLVLACDGLWDFVTEEEVARAVYQQVYDTPGDLEAVSQKLVQLSKEQGSTDNISVIVVFLTDPVQLASRPVDVWEHLSKNQAPSNTMDTSNNPFASDSVPFPKPGLLLDLGASGDVFKQNGTAPSANDLYFLDRPANGKGNFDDDDFGPETDVDAVDDVLLSPAKIANSQRNNNPFEIDEFDKRTIEEDLEIQRQQTSDFDPVRETRQETPTPPADEVPGVTNLVPEPDNVAESGEDSEDEWNYYRVEPTADTADSNQQSTQQVCEKTAAQLEEEENMESQLNPNAAEFVPSPTQLMPTMEDILLAESPKKGITMENISVPSHNEFQEEVSQRPSELDLTDEPLMIPQQKIAAKLPDLISTEEGGDANPFLPPGAICGKSIHHLENGDSFKDFLERGDRNFKELQSSNLQASGGLALDESEVSSTKAEFGDDSTMSFMTSDLQKTTTENVSSITALEKSFTDHDVLETEFTSELTSSDVNEFSDLNESEFCKEVTTEESFREEQDSMIIKNTQDAVHMSFEIQKELVPEMESKPERVQLESEGTSSFEQDESSSPVLQGDSKVSDLDIADFKAPITEEKHITSKVEDFLEAEISAIGQNELSFSGLNNAPLSPIPPQHGEQVSPLLDLSKSPTPQIDAGGLSPKQLTFDDGVSPFSQLSSKPSQSPPQSPVSSNKSLQSPPQSPLLSKPELSPLQSDDLEQNLETLPKSPLIQSPPKSPLLEQLQSPELSIPVQQQTGTPQSPVLSKSPIWEASSPLPSAADTALSTPETVPAGKDETQSPLLETKSPVDFSPFEAQLQTSQDKYFEKVDEIIENTHKNEPFSKVCETEFEITDLRHPSNAVSADFILEESLAESSDLLAKPVEVDATQVPPPTPAQVSENVLAAELIKESKSIVEKLDSSTEKVDVVTEKIDLETEKTEKKETEIITAAVTAAALSGTVAAAAVELAKPEAEKKSPAETKKAAAAAKDKKTPVPDKTKAIKTTTTTTKSATKVNLKTPTPTSPTKPLTSTARTSTPKKPSTATTTSTSLTSKVTRSPATAAAKPKPTGTSSSLTTKTTASAARTTATTKPATAASRPKPASTTTSARSTVLTNGEAAKPAPIKKLATTTAAKPPSRPATAPAATKTTTTKQVTSVTNRTTVSTPPRPKPGAVNGTTTKPRTLGTVAPAAARNKVGITRDTKLATDKQVKETANKQISSSRSVTATKTATTTTAKRVSGVTKTSASVTNTTKSAVSKTAAKKTIASATSKTTTKTAVTVTTTATENNEHVQVQVQPVVD